MRSGAVAILAGVALAPLLVVFPPVYFPWTLLVAASAGSLVGLAGGARTARLDVAACIVAAILLFIIAVLAFGLPTVGSLSPALLAVFWWLFVPMAAGAITAGVLRRRLGTLRALGVSIGGAVALAVIGVALAFALAPPDAADAPQCDGVSTCARSTCWVSAERIRLLTLERVTRYGDGSITCVYTGWGGVQVGTARGAPGFGSGWEDGWWPRLLRTWTP